MPSAQPRWTVLVWIAGDNNLDSFGLSDLGELKKVGSTDDIAVVAQFDRAGNVGTHRYYLRKDTTLEDDLVEDLGETNTGDPSVAIDFFTWGMTRWPSDHVLAVLWNHGSGIDETDIYARAVAPAKSTVPRGALGEVLRGGMRRALFMSTIDTAMHEKGIGYDDAERDFLDNAELRDVLTEVARATDRRIDILGFDACLMDLIEIAYELREHVDYLVASEEVEPGNGWPYDAVIRALTAAPDAKPGDVAANIVQAYVDSYRGDESLTQSALDLSRVSDTAKAVDGLAAACISAFDTAPGYIAVTKALKRAQRFHVRDYADLGDICTRLADDAAPIEVRDAAAAVLESLTGASPLVVKAAKHGPSVERSSGAAVYFPLVGDVKVSYDRLAFARDTRWNELIAKYNLV